MTKEQRGLLAYYRNLPACVSVSPKSDFLAEVCKACGVSISTARNWCFGRTLPKEPVHIAELSRITGIPADELFY